MRRVVITGMGAVTPVGNSAPESWRNLLNGVSGVGRITLFDPSEYAVQIAGEVKNFSPEGIIDPKEMRHMDRSVQLALVAAKEDFRNSRRFMAELVWFGFDPASRRSSKSSPDRANTNRRWR